MKAEQRKGNNQSVGFVASESRGREQQPQAHEPRASIDRLNTGGGDSKTGASKGAVLSSMPSAMKKYQSQMVKKEGKSPAAGVGGIEPGKRMQVKGRLTQKQPKELSVHNLESVSSVMTKEGKGRRRPSPRRRRAGSANSNLSQLSARSNGSNLSVHSYGSRKSKRSHLTSGTTKPGRSKTKTQQHLTSIEDRFKALRYLFKQKLHPFDFGEEELGDMKKLFPEFKPQREGTLLSRQPLKNNGIPILELITELQRRIKIDEKDFVRMIGQLDRKDDTKVTWNEFLHFLTNEGIRRETVNDAQLYGYGIKRIKKTGRHHLRKVDQYQGPEKLAEYYIDGMVLIKLKNIKLLLNLFENKEAKLYDLRTLQPIQHLVFASDYSVPKPKRNDHRGVAGKKGAHNTAGQGQDGAVTGATATIETIKTQQDGLAFQHSLTGLTGVNVTQVAEVEGITNTESQDTINHLPFDSESATQIKSHTSLARHDTQQSSSMLLLNNVTSAAQGIEPSKAGQSSTKRRTTQQPQALISRQVSAKTRKVAKSIERSRGNKVNFHPTGAKAQQQQQSTTAAAVQNFADVDLDSVEVGLKSSSAAYSSTAVPHKLTKPTDSHSKGKIHLPLNNLGRTKSQLRHQSTKKGLPSTFEHSSTAQPGLNRASTILDRVAQDAADQVGGELAYVGSDSDLTRRRAVSQIEAWKTHDSHHKRLLRKEKEQERLAKEQEERDQKHCINLGIADLTSKNSARDFMERANEKNKAKMKLGKNMSKIQNQDADLKKELDANRKKFYQKFEQFDKKMKKFDKSKEDAFLEAYKQKELADIIARDQSHEPYGGHRDEEALRRGDSVSTGGAYRSTTGSRLGSTFKRRRGTANNTATVDQESSGRHSAVKSHSVQQHGRKETGGALLGHSKMPREANLIHPDIDYFTRVDLVDRTIKATGYIPLAMRDQASKLQLSEMRIDRMLEQQQRCERALERTQDKKNDCMKKVLRIKEANRFFFTQNPLSPPYYYPQSDERDEKVQSKDTNHSDHEGDFNDRGMTPRTQAKVDHKLLFGDNEKPLPCEPGVIKKALDERMRKDSQAKQAFERQQAAQLRKEKEQKISRKIKTTKEIYTVAADFCQDRKGERAIVALALIDQQIIVYQVKQSGVKITMVETFSFYVKFPGKACVSSLCLDHYVTDDRPIICVGSQLGDIAVYYLDHVSSKTGKIGPKLIIQFNFFERGFSKAQGNTSEMEAEGDDVDSLLDRQTTHFKANSKSFVKKISSNDTDGQLSQQKSIGLGKKLLYDEPPSDHDSNDEKDPDATSALKLSSQPFSTAALMLESSKQIQEDFWEVLMNTRPKKEGPNGIQLWNRVFKRVKDEDSAITLTKSLIKMKLDSLDAIDHIIDRWLYALRCNGNQPRMALPDFEEDIECFRAELLRKAKADKKSKERAPRGSRARTAQGSNAKAGVASQSRKKGDKSGIKESFGLNSIIEDQLENVSNYGGDEPSQEDTFHKSMGPSRGKTGGHKALSSTDADKSSNPQTATTLQSKKPKNPISKIKYVKDIGLIATTFNGTIKFFDAFNFHQTWKNDNKARGENQHTSICTFDVSSPLGIMVTGGAEGLLLSIDPHALGVTNQAEAHKGKDILSVFVFVEQQQIISVCEDRTVCLWDAFRLVKLQTIKDQGEDIHIPKFSSASFDNATGQLYIGDQLLSTWACEVDPIVEINALQVQTLSEAMAKERNLQPLRQLSSEFSRQSIKQTDARTGSVLISKMSSLVGILCNEYTQFSNYFATVDTENLCRFWNLKEHSTNITFKIPMKQVAPQQTRLQPDSLFFARKRITACDINSECTLIAVGNQVGEAFVTNSNSGGIIYRLPGATEEISAIKFLSGQSEFWIVAALWHGRVIFWTQPNEQNNFTINAKIRVGHRGDINMLDCQQSYIISGGQDGLLGVWNQFSGVLKYAIKLPDPVDESLPQAAERKRSATQSAIKENASFQATAQQTSNQMRRTVVGLMFHPFWQNVALVLQEGGNIHAVDVSNGMIVNDFLAQVQMNSSWAIDPTTFNMMVVGDQGKAVLFNAQMGAEHTFKEHNPLPQSVFNFAVKQKKVNSKRVPVYAPRIINPATGEIEKWSIIKNWFTAHTFSKTEPNFVNTVKFSSASNLFITSTNFGEVKLWDNTSCMPLGVINSTNFKPDHVMDFILRSHQVDSSISQAMDHVQKQIKGTLKSSPGSSLMSSIHIPECSMN